MTAIRIASAIPECLTVSQAVCHLIRGAGEDEGQTPELDAPCAAGNQEAGRRSPGGHAEWPR
jgi:hypothetical protein